MKFPQMLRHRLDAEGEETTSPIHWKLRVTNQAAADNEQSETHYEKPNPGRTCQSCEEHEDLRREKTDAGHEQESPMFKE